MGRYFQGMMDSTGAAIFVSFLFMFALLALAISLIPGIIATRAKHPYALYIWLLATVGSLFTAGLSWIGALVWALIPPKNSTGAISTSPAPSSGANTWSPATPSNTASKLSTVEEQLAELQRLLDSKQIRKTEYEALRKKTLGL